jgi:hypothetical protein
MKPPATNVWAYLEQIAFPNMFAASSALSWTTDTWRGVRCRSHSWRRGGGSSTLHRYCTATVRCLLVPRALICNHQVPSIKTVVNLSYVRPSQFLYSACLCRSPICRSLKQAITPTTIYWLSLSDLHSTWKRKTWSRSFWYLGMEPPGGDRLCGLVVRVPGYRSRGSGSVPGATKFSEK